MKPSRPALRYHGGKWKLAPWIISHFPEHYCYVEPFGGGASVLLRKDPSPLEVYNDLDGDVVNFFSVLRAQPEELIRAIQLTPFSREEFEIAKTSSEDPLENARRVYIRAFQSISSHVGRVSGWKCEKSKGSNKASISSWNNTSYLWDVVDRFMQVQIENQDAFKVIQRYDTPQTLFYLDPPYIESTLSSGKNYKHRLTNQDHKRLAAVLNEIQGMAVISGYPTDLYNKIYKDWHMISKPARTNTRSGRKEDCLWFPPNIKFTSTTSLYLPL